MTDLVYDLRQMTGMDHVGVTAHKAADEIEQLRAALTLLLAECVASGNADAKDYGWPKAIAAARVALAPDLYAGSPDSL